MSRGPGRETKVLVEVIEDALNHAAGDLSPVLDDLAIEYRKRAGCTLREAAEIIERRIDPAIRLLEEDGWFPTKATEYYIVNYKGQTPNHPQTQVDINRCVAGAGTAAPTYALHFCVTDDCVLFMQARILGLDSGEKKIQHGLRRMAGVAELGQLSPDGVGLVVMTAGLSPRKEIRKVLRIAAKAGVR